MELFPRQVGPENVIHLKDWKTVVPQKKVKENEDAR